LAPSPLARNFAPRIKDSISYQLPAVAAAVQNDLDDVLDSGKVTSAQVVALVGEAQLVEFEWLVASRPRFFSKLN